MILRLFSLKMRPTRVSVSQTNIPEKYFFSLKVLILRTSELLLNTPHHLVDLVNCFNTTLKSITDKHAPWRKRSMTQRAQAPWSSDEIRSAERHRRIAERNWRSSKSESDWRAFKLLRNKVVFLMNKYRREFYTDFVGNFSDDQRKLFAATKNC